MRKRWKGEERGNRVFKEGGEEEKRESEQRKAKEKTREVSPTIGVTLINQKRKNFPRVLHNSESTFFTQASPVSFKLDRRQGHPRLSPRGRHSSTHSLHSICLPSRSINNSFTRRRLNPISHLSLPPPRSISIPWPCSFLASSSSNPHPHTFISSISYNATLSLSPPLFLFVSLIHPQFLLKLLLLSLSLSAFHSASSFPF